MDIIELVIDADRNEVRVLRLQPKEYLRVKPEDPIPTKAEMIARLVLPRIRELLAMSESELAHSLAMTRIADAQLDAIRQGRRGPVVSVPSVPAAGLPTLYRASWECRPGDSALLHEAQRDRIPVRLPIGPHAGQLVLIHSARLRPLGLGRAVCDISYSLKPGA